MRSRLLQHAAEQVAEVARTRLLGHAAQQVATVLISVFVWQDVREVAMMPLPGCPRRPARGLAFVVCSVCPLVTVDPFPCDFCCPLVLEIPARLLVHTFGVSRTVSCISAVRRTKVLHTLRKFRSVWHC